MATPTFSLTSFQALFPQYAWMSQNQVTPYFAAALDMFGNTPCAQCFAQPEDGSQSTVLNFLIGHMVQLLGVNQAGQPNTPLVGRITGAAQGSVNVDADMPNQPQSAAWYQQTQAGAMFWTLTAKCRQFQYAPGPRRNLDPFNPLMRGRY